MKIDFFGQTDVGRKREKNEDSIYIDGERGLFVVADGMGGHLGGEFASKLAVKTINESLSQLTEDPDMTLKRDIGIDRLDPSAQLKYAIGVASKNIYEDSQRNPSLRGMGTTTVALLIRDHKGYIANVGDSRLYLVRGGQISQITSDHSLVAEQLKAGMITEAETKNHKFKNIITRSVGFQPEVEVDILVHDLDEGDSFLLCSDGLTNMISNQQIAEIISKNSARDACQKLIDSANQKGGDDNISVIVVSIQGKE